MKKVYCILVLSFICISSFSQAIKNIEVEMIEGNQAMITYDFTYTKFNQSYDISVFVSKDRGESFIGPLEYVTGDVGENIKKGKRKIIWDFLKEMPFIEEELIFDVRAIVSEEELKKEYFAQYVSLLGARFGKIGGNSWFVEAEVTDGQSLIGGMTFQTSWNTYLYGGAGIQFTRYAYTSDEIGFVLSGGIIKKYDNLLISVGLRATDAKVEFNIGIGLPLKKF